MIQQLEKKLTLLNGDIELHPEQKIIHFIEFGLGDSVNSICIIKGTKKAFPENQMTKLLLITLSIFITKEYLSRSALKLKMESLYPIWSDFQINGKGESKQEP